MAISLTSTQVREMFGDSTGGKLLNFFNEARKGVVKFSYTKLNGEVREAEGTINPELIKDMLTPEQLEVFKGYFPIDQVDFSLFDERGINNYFHYIDIGSGPGIRQFKPDTLIF